MKPSSVFLLVVLTASLPGQAVSQAAQPSIVITLGTAQGTVKASTKISVEISLTNRSSKRIYMDVRTPAACEYAVDVHEEDGNTPPEKRYLKALRGRDTGSPTIVQLCGGGTISLEPHQTWTETLDVSKLYDLSKPDKYTIQVSRFDNESKTRVKSNKLTLTVTP